MKYKCDQGHTFIHTAKIKEPFTSTEGTFQESQCCPKCLEANDKINLNYEEVIEEVPKAILEPISALLPVPNEEVNKRLAEGYQVMEDQIRAKETIMIKRGPLIIRANAPAQIFAVRDNMQGYIDSVWSKESEAEERASIASKDYKGTSYENSRWRVDPWDVKTKEVSDGKPTVN